ncbi:MraY family glycosyltransferase [Pseudoxanthomonas sp. 10H]|uniref:MraY family glycosyltransferase n=1 Tax=Pseudoxanthomonas sp. 10H TaxID=3242729 RepID=UPI00355650F5
MGPVAWLAFHSAVSALATWLALLYARRRNLVDLPGDRRSHAEPTPRGGGIGITVALLAGCVVAVHLSVMSPMQAACAAGGLLLVAGIGWIDDHRPLSPWTRLAVQCAAGLVLAWGLHGAEGRWMLALVTAGLVPVLVNVWNFMDGIDGLATTQAMLASIAFVLLAPSAGPAGWALAAAAAGFLPFNFPRARIFLGDVGSGTLGYALAWVASLGTLDRPGLPMAVLLLPFCAFLVDATLTLARRMLAGEAWWKPHATHLYQQWVRSGKSHRYVTSIYAAFSFVTAILALFLNMMSPAAMGTATGVWFAFATLGWFWLRRRITG